MKKQKDNLLSRRKIIGIGSCVLGYGFARTLKGLLGKAVKLFLAKAQSRKVFDRITGLLKGLTGLIFVTTCLRATHRQAETLRHGVGGFAIKPYVRTKSRAIPAGLVHSFKMIVILLLLVGVFGAEVFGKDISAMFKVISIIAGSFILIVSALMSIIYSREIEQTGV